MQFIMTHAMHTHLSELERLAGLGVSAVQLSVPRDALQHALEAIEEFGKSVINAYCGGQT